MRLCCQCMSTHSFSPPFACLLSSLDPKPHRIPHFLSFCQTPLHLHSPSSPPGETKALVAFPSLLVRLEAKDRQGCGSAKSAPPERQHRFFYLNQVRGKYDFELFHLSFLSYSPKLRPAALLRQNTYAHAGGVSREADAASTWEYFNILTC